MPRHLFKRTGDGDWQDLGSVPHVPAIVVDSDGEIWTATERDFIASATAWSNSTPGPPTHYEFRDVPSSTE